MLCDAVGWRLPCHGSETGSIPVCSADWVFSYSGESEELLTPEAGFNSQKALEKFSMDVKPRMARDLTVNQVSFGTDVGSIPSTSTCRSSPTVGGHRFKTGTVRVRVSLATLGLFR